MRLRCRGSGSLRSARCSSAGGVLLPSKVYAHRPCAPVTLQGLAWCGHVVRYGRLFLRSMFLLASILRLMVRSALYLPNPDFDPDRWLVCGGGRVSILESVSSLLRSTWSSLCTRPSLYTVRHTPLLPAPHAAASTLMPSHAVGALVHGSTAALREDSGFWRGHTKGLTSGNGAHHSALRACCGCMLLSSSFWSHIRTRTPVPMCRDPAASVSARSPLPRRSSCPVDSQLTVPCPCVMCCAVLCRGIQVGTPI
jgi:hypothetical protein